MAAVLLLVSATRVLRTDGQTKVVLKRNGFVPTVRNFGLECYVLPLNLEELGWLPHFNNFLVQTKVGV